MQDSAPSRIPSGTATPFPYSPVVTWQAQALSVYFQCHCIAPSAAPSDDEYPAISIIVIITNHRYCHHHHQLFIIIIIITTITTHHRHSCRHRRRNLNRFLNSSDCCFVCAAGHLQGAQTLCAMKANNRSLSFATFESNKAALMTAVTIVNNITGSREPFCLTQATPLADQKPQQQKQQQQHCDATADAAGHGRAPLQPRAPFRLVTPAFSAACIQQQQQQQQRPYSISEEARGPSPGPSSGSSSFTVVLYDSTSIPHKVKTLLVAAAAQATADCSCNKGPTSTPLAGFVDEADENAPPAFRGKDVLVYSCSSWEPHYQDPGKIVMTLTSAYSTTRMGRSPSSTMECCTGGMALLAGGFKTETVQRGIEAHAEHCPRCSNPSQGVESRWGAMAANLKQLTPALGPPPHKKPCGPWRPWNLSQQG